MVDLWLKGVREEQSLALEEKLRGNSRETHPVADLLKGITGSTTSGIKGNFECLLVIAARYINFEDRVRADALVGNPNRMFELLAACAKLSGVSTSGEVAARTE